MAAERIREIIAELKRERNLVDEAINSLQTLLVRRNGYSSIDQTVSPQAVSVGSSFRVFGKQLTYLDATVQILGANGSPMHIKAIVTQIQGLRDNPNIKRQSVESTLLRHIEIKGEEARVRKVGRGLYTLPRTTLSINPKDFSTEKE